MKQCWPEGDLRAYRDGELALDAGRDLAVHLEACEACGARYWELSDRAARVSKLLAVLPEMAPMGAVPSLRLPVRHRRQWAVAALSLAAAVALGFVLLPKRASQVAQVVQPPVAAIPAEKSPVVVPAARRRPARRRATQPALEQAADYFLRLDDEPLETGTIVRVGAENGDVQADLILGPDGRAHAIRVIGNQ
jgi:anti-sigma factor RsiW